MLVLLLIQNLVDDKSHKKFCDCFTDLLRTKRSIKIVTCCLYQIIDISCLVEGQSLKMII